VPITTTSVPLSFTLINTGTAPLAINASGGIAISGANATDFVESDNCPRAPSTIAANANCTITVKVTPSATGARAGTLTITDNDKHSPTDTSYPQTVSLGGTGTDFTISAAPPSVTVSPGKFATYTLTLTPVSGFSQTLALACSTAPAASKTTCAVPNSVAVNSAVTTVNAVTAKNSQKGTYTITFTAKFTATAPATGMLSHSATAKLIVK